MDGERHAKRRSLSSQELACLKLLATGKSNKEVARVLDLSPATVASYLKAVYRKLGTQSRTHAVAIAIREGIVDLGQEEEG